MPNATSPRVERRVVAFALGHPGFDYYNTDRAHTGRWTRGH